MELMSNQELKMLMMQMTETQRVWGCRYMETASPGLAPRRSRDWGFLFSEWGRYGFVCPCGLRYGKRDLSEGEQQAASEWGAVRQVAKRETGASGRGAARRGEEDR